MTAKQRQACIRESHRQQFAGRDYQQAAYDALGEVGATTAGGPEVSDDDLREIESSPDEFCECGFCQTAKWGSVCS